MKNCVKDYALHFEKSIYQWDEALPLGNGKLGCLLYGGGPLRFALDRVDLWDERESATCKNKEFTYQKLIDCIKQGENGWADKQRIFEINRNYPYPTKLSAGAILLDFGQSQEDIRSTLDIYTAKAQVSSECFRAETFVCAHLPVGVIRVVGDYTIRLKIPDYFSGDEKGKWSTLSGLVDNDGNVQVIENGCLQYPPAKVGNENDFTYYIQNTLTEYSFGVVILQKQLKDCTELYYTIVTSADAEDFIAYGKQRLIESAETGFDRLFAEHKKWWESYWQKSSLTIPDKRLEKTYYVSWYLFASTSRGGGYPMALQGVWTADSNAIPPWKGDYHHDTNTEMSYWGYGKANRLEEGRVFADYLWDMRETFRSYAQKIYGVDGYIVPGCSSLGGMFMGGWVQFSMSPSMTIWATKAFDDYYRYSADKEFLKTRAFPFLKEVARAIRSLLEERNGKLYLPLSTSPEIYEEKRENFLIGNTNFDQSLLLYLFKTLSEFAEILGEDGTEYRDVLSSLDALYVSKDNILMLSEKMKLPFSHRHFSHLMSIYPLKIFNYDTPEHKKIIDNSILELEQLGTGWWVGFSFAWCATLYAMQYNGNASYEKLRAFVKGFLSPNGFHLNGDYKKLGFTQWHYRPFTLEALFAYCDCLQEMCLQEHKGYVELFPAIPEDWTEEVSFERFRVYGGVLISAKKRENKIQDITLIAPQDMEICIKNNFSSAGVFTVQNATNSEYFCPFGEVCTIVLKKGENYIG